MLNQPSNREDDPWLINSFEVFEKMPAVSKDQVDWTVSTDFRIYAEFLKSDILKIQRGLVHASDTDLFDTCEHIFNIIDWITLMVYDAGFPTLATSLEDVFESSFGDKHILNTIYDDSFEKWISTKTGQQKIGMNFYNVLEGNLYYRNRFSQWFEVDRKTAFDIKPNRKSINDSRIIDRLNDEYQETWYDTIINLWSGKEFQGTLPSDFLRFRDIVTTPEANFAATEIAIKSLLVSPVSIAELERWNGEEITDLEETIKIQSRILDIVAERRSDQTHTLYLLRDCLTFYEAHKTLDILSSETSSFDQLMIGRKLLSHRDREWGYYALMLASLYDAHERCPVSFEEFYSEYARLLNRFVELNHGFAEVIADLADYIKPHLETDKERITVFDIGFQGSIALLTKYIIDRHIQRAEATKNFDTDIKIGVGSLWSKELFGDRYMSFYFPFLNRVQLLTRSNDLYHFKTLKSNEIQVTMGDRISQQKAAIELVSLVTIAKLDHDKERANPL